MRSSKGLPIGRVVLATALSVAGLAVSTTGTSAAVDTPPAIAEVAATEGIAPGNVVDIDITPNALGYWVTLADGSVLAQNAPLFGDRPALNDGETVAALAPSRSGQGYWLFTTTGRAFAYGDANHYGDMITVLPPGTALNGAIYDAIPTASGRGYYMLGDDGGIFAFGDAEFFGSVPGLFAPGGPAEGGRLAAPVVGISPTPSGQGYWLVAEDGGTFAFGDAEFVGSVPGLFLPTGPNPGGALNAPVIGMIGQGDGYILLGSDGGIFNFGQSIFHGSLGGLDVPAPIVNATSLEDQSGYLMVDTEGRVYGFGDVRPLIAPQMFTTTPPQDVVIDPEVAEIGQSIALSAGHLGLVEGQVTIDGADVPLTYWAGTPDDTAGTVVFPVPDGLANGFHDLVVSNRIGSGAPQRGLVVVGGPDDSGTELRISSAAATSNTEIVVQFTKAVDPRRAELPANYTIGAADIADAAGGATVRVTSAEVIRPSLTTVRLTTLPQSETDYSLKAVDIVDLAGAPLAAATGPSPRDPSLAEFRGVGPNIDGQLDTDDDGVTDADEQRGWLVSVRAADGSVTRRVVTSDPEAADTDGDGVSDLEERHASSDPRSPDTDGDRLSDGDEWNVVLSSPVDQDTDGDGSQDGLEFYTYRTSPLVADTDGDQISDSDEILTRSRDPRIADLPAHEITVGDIRLQLDQRFTYQDDTGRVVSTTDTTESTLNNTTRNERTTGGSLTFKGGLSVETGFEGLTFSFKVTPSFEVESTSQWSDTSVRETQQAFQQSLARATELSSTNTVTREVIGARVDADVTIENQGDVAFEIKSLEVTVSERVPGSTVRLAPVATLVANSSLITGEDTTFSLGPFDRARGPVLFSSLDVFPNLIERIMADPSSLVFNVANYEVVDELGRRFTFADQVARDRTGGILVDAGDGQVQRHLVATALQRDVSGLTGAEVVGGFDANGAPIGVPLDFALQDTLGLSKNSTTPDGIVSTDQTTSSRAVGDDIQLIPRGTTGVPVGSVIVAAGPNGVLDSVAVGADVADVTTGYETAMVEGVETLVRFGAQRNGDLNRQWVVLSTGEAPVSADFGELVLDAGEDFYLVFVQDLDQDGLFSRTEFLAGSTDSLADRYDNSTFGQVGPAPLDSAFPLVDPVEVADGIADSKDTDRDGLGDFAELRVGWTVSAADGTLGRTFSSPRLADSDGDGLLDPQEQDLRSFCQPDDPRRDALCTFQDAPAVERDEAIAIIAGPNGAADTQATGDDVQTVTNGRSGLTYAARIISPGANGVIDSALAGDDEYESRASGLRIPPATSPILGDSDGDGVSDFEELVGFRVGVAIRDGGPACDTCRGVAQSQAIGDDIQAARLSGPVAGGGIVVLPGPNGTIESVAGGDDVVAAGSDVQTDPLRQDTDSDLVVDGRERDVGSDPTNPDDAADFRDSDQDGLTDAEESILGWHVDVNAAPGAPACPPVSSTCRFVLSNPSRPDSDNDGLPDLAERIIRTDPNTADTDGDGISDFDELADFTQFRGLEVANPGFVVDGDTSQRYGSDPTLADSDRDGLTDREELITGYYLLLADEAQPRFVRTNPVEADTDLDGVSDFDERSRTPATDASDPDTDDDGRNDGIERQTGTDPRQPDVSVTVRFGTLAIDKIGDDFLCQLFNLCGLAFFYTVTPPGLARQLVATANQAPNARRAPVPPANPSCTSLVLQRNRAYTYPLAGASRTFTLRPGETFQIDGIIFDHDFIGNVPSGDCGRAPNYIPTSVGAGCVTRFSQVFEFEDFDAGGQANFPFPDGSDTDQQCDWEQQVYVSSR